MSTPSGADGDGSPSTEASGPDGGAPAAAPRTSRPRAGREVEPDAATLSAWFEEYHRTGDRRLRNQLVEAHQHIADFFSKRYSNRGVPRDDLRQTALLAILRAVERFDPRMGVSFGTFASRTVDGELKRYFRDRTWSVRPPRQAQELHLVVRRTEESLAQSLGRSPTVLELAKEIGAEPERILEAMEAGLAHEATSLDQPANGDTSSEGSPRAVGRSDPRFGHVEMEVVIGELLADLDEREQQVVFMRFYENRTQSEIAEAIGVSQSYLSRILRKVFAQLRAQLVEGT
jgi:RNA polymerase sigma-B factor